MTVPPPVPEYSPASTLRRAFMRLKFPGMTGENVLGEMWGKDDV